VGRASSPNQGGAGGTDFCDGSVAVDNRSEEAHAADRVESPLPKIELIPGFHGKSNSSAIKVILLKTL